jgi:hypothetical protein
MSYMKELPRYSQGARTYLLVILRFTSYWNLVSKRQRMRSGQLEIISEVSEQTDYEFYEDLPR